MLQSLLPMSKAAVVDAALPKLGLITDDRRERESVGTSDLDALIDHVIRIGFDPETIGRAILKLAEEPLGIERAVAFSAMVAKARSARIKRASK